VKPSVERVQVEKVERGKERKEWRDREVSKVTNRE
jgi:hypothetical protein